MSKPSYLQHDDYEDFAKRYLGVDYEDLVNLELGYSDDDFILEQESELIDYEIPSFV